jgi:hypothetical protein
MLTRPLFCIFFYTFQTYKEFVAQLTSWYQLKVVEKGQSVAGN